MQRSATFAVEAAVWNALSPGSAVQVELGDGALGMPWHGREVRVSGLAAR